MLFIYSKVRVRRWCKRPPADGWSSGCAIWGLQVHVYHRLRASRSIPFRIRWRVECWRRRATCVVDKWQKARRPVMAAEKQNPAYRGTVSNFFINYFLFRTGVILLGKVLYITWAFIIYYLSIYYILLGEVLLYSGNLLAEPEPEFYTFNPDKSIL